MVKHIDEYEAVFGEDSVDVPGFHHAPKPDAEDQGGDGAAPARRRRKPRSGDGDEDYEMDEVTGAHGRRRKLDILNKKKVSKYELDELFCEP